MCFLSQKKKKKLSGIISLFYVHISPSVFTLKCPDISVGNSWDVPNGILIW